MVSFTVENISFMEIIYSTDQNLAEFTIEILEELLETAPEALDARLRHFLYEDLLNIENEAAQDEEEFIVVGDPETGPWVVEVSKKVVKAVSKMTENDMEELASGLSATNEAIQMSYAIEDIFYQLEDFQEIAADAIKNKKTVFVVMAL